MRLNRAEYLSRQHEFTARGVELPQSKLTEENIQAIREAKDKRSDLLQHIKEHLSNAVLAEKFGVHIRTIEKVMDYGSWRHVKTDRLF